MAQEATRFLGAMNGAIVVMASLTLLRPPSDSLNVFLFFSAANLSQFILDIYAHKRKISLPGLTKITFGDGLLFVLNLGIALALIFG